MKGKIAPCDDDLTLLAEYVFHHTMAKQRIWASLDPFYESGPLMGRKVANAAFLNALLQLDPFDAYHFFPMSRPMLENLEQALAQQHPSLTAQGRIVLHYRRELPHQLRSCAYYCFHQSDCINYQPHLARVRNLCSAEIFPITGGIHSLSLASYAERFLAHLWPGTTPRDAIVATSQAGREAVARFFREARTAYGLSGEYREPRLETIPLGVNAEGMQPLDATSREALRQKMDIPEETTAFLCFGRLEHHSKMDILPLFRAFMRLFMDGVPREKVVLLLAGWADEGDDFPDELRALAKGFNLDLRLVLRPDKKTKTELFQAADIFVSIADNPQETFGLTILEAGAFALPVIASDYDGYKDLVQDEGPGLLVPTIGPDTTQEIDAMSRLLFDNQYHLPLAQRLVVDVPALARCMGCLLADPAGARDMGRAGRVQAMELTWTRCVREHLRLWDELWEAPVVHVEHAENVESGLKTVRHPLQVPYARIFEGYPTQILDGKLTLQISRAGQAVYRDIDHPVIYEGISGIVSTEAVHALLFAARKPQTVEQLVGMIMEPGLIGRIGGIETVEQAEALVLWALKHDFLERCA
ncbi:MAG: glycosyltransferase family 4 protein [Desulfovibrio sp.]|uniref:glycosyltransferase family 4 protein n=1 Tax=Desulfovibrio sp. 7SRBS1 TaxID=3378064 RepID=UPI003B3DEBB6